MNYLDKQSQTKQQSLALEKKIINAVLMGKCKHNIHEIKDYWFIDEKLRKVFQIISEHTLNATDYHPDIIKNKLTTILADCYTNDYIVDTDELIKQKKEIWLKYKLTETIQVHSEKEIESPHTAISDINADLNKLLDGHEVEDVDFQHIYELYQEAEKEYHNKKEGELIGYHTGFEKLDEATDGLRNGHLWILGGYTSAGKTQAVLNIAKNLMEQEVPVSIYSLEMSKEDVFKRLLGIITKVPSSLLLKKKDLDSVTQGKKEKAIELMRNSGIRVHTEKNLLNDILMSMTVEYVSGKAKAFIIDYAQLIQIGKESEYDTMRILSTKLQAFCRKNNIPVVLVSQVSNENAKNPNSDIIGFKGSGALAASADVAIELMAEDSGDEKKEKIANGEPIQVKMAVKKNRHGRIINTILNFQTNTGVFSQQPVDNF